MNASRTVLNEESEVKRADTALASASSIPLSEGTCAERDLHSAEAVYLPEEPVFISADASSTLRSSRSNSAEEAFTVTLSVLSRIVAMSKSPDSIMGRTASASMSFSSNSGSDADISRSFFALFTEIPYPGADSSALSSVFAHLSECSNDSSANRVDGSSPEITTCATSLS